MIASLALVLRVLWYFMLGSIIPSFVFAMFYFIPEPWNMVTVTFCMFSAVLGGAIYMLTNDL